MGFEDRPSGPGFGDRTNETWQRDSLDLAPDALIVQPAIDAVTLMMGGMLVLGDLTVQPVIDGVTLGAADLVLADLTVQPVISPLVLVMGGDLVPADLVVQPAIEGDVTLSMGGILVVDDLAAQPRIAGLVLIPIYYLTLADLLVQADIEDPDLRAISPSVVSIKGKVRDDGRRLVDPDDYERNLAEALRRYSKYRPDTKVADVTGNGTHNYALPTGWNEGFSMIVSIESPIGEVPAAILDEDTYSIYQDTHGKAIRLDDDLLSTHESFRVTFTILRTLATVPDIDSSAVYSLAASMCLEDLASAYAQTTDSTISADAVNYRTKSAEFAARAKQLFKLYKDHMGIKEDDTTPPASATADYDEKYPGGSERLTHRRWARKRR